MIKRRKKSLDQLMKEKQAIEARNNFFMTIWKEKLPHNCENCSRFLGKIPLSYMFDHILEKSKYPQLAFEKDNIEYLCLECHDNKSRGHISPIIDMNIKRVKNQFNII